MLKEKNNIQYIADYRLENYRQFIFCVSKKKEADLIEHLLNQESVAGYLKKLIRADMASKKSDLTSD